MAFLFLFLKMSGNVFDHFGEIQLNNDDNYGKKYICGQVLYHVNELQTFSR